MKPLETLEVTDSHMPPLAWSSPDNELAYQLAPIAHMRIAHIALVRRDKAPAKEL